MSSLPNQIPIFIFFLLCSVKKQSVFLAEQGEQGNTQDWWGSNSQSFIEISQRITN